MITGRMPGARVTSLPVPLQRSREALATVVAGATVLLLVLSIFPLLQGPDFVPHLTLINPTAYQVNIDITGAGEKGWLDLGTVPREREVALQGVVDQGRDWTFRFTSGGVYAGEMTLSRADLEREHWRVNVPAGITVPLQEAGLPASAS